ncbi:UDP-N-acetylmuramate dehydrogenase, partial [candidate division WOR-3 bacterium]|nr:UDP-N-acetylmuramate dehydrogenase [candidate division WOR-3 bacterium]
NILCSDRGFNGVVLKLKGTFTRITEEKGIYTCGSGVMLRTLLASAGAQGHGGAEFLAGIPGTIGGAVYCNAGAFGHAIGDITDRVTLLTRQGEIKDIQGKRIPFRYRRSGLPRSVIVLSAVLQFQKKSVRKIRQQLRDIEKYRRERQPQGFSAGSYFKNPRPRAAGKLIDDCGMKGMCVGEAVVSTRHANWIINRGQATARDVIALASLIKRTVRRHTGVVLQEEVRRLK